MQPQIKQKPAATLESLYQLIQDDLKRVDATILSRIRQDAPLIYDVAHHIIASGGKRIRPAVTLISAQLCGYQGTQHIGLASAVELLHTATLLHDDVVDESDLRRGLATANNVFGNKASILVGDFLLSQAFQLMASDGSLESLRILSDASAIISQGEVLQLMYQGNIAVTEEDHIKILSAKTAALFSAAAELGAVIAEKPEWQTPLNTYGHAIGLAFQMVDDALDYGADQQKLGKNVGDDFREGKITLPVLFAYADADATERAFWQRTMGERVQEEKDLAQAIAYLTQHRAISRTVERAVAETTVAKTALDIFPDSPAKNAMLDVADFCIARAY